MNHNHYELLKKSYEDGYRCIRTDEEHDTLTVHLKNFETEQIDTISCSDSREKNKMKNFIEENGYI